ncbi:hypothetical protein, partial [Lysinibacillus sp. NPDC056232]|uniref:hypothetical protein n=1 Tax=Lysinibacillus sp. NPDC056232 TaxID=3345756 RepID=UPI0035DE3760
LNFIRGNWMLYLEIRYVEYDIEKFIKDKTNSVVKVRNEFDVNVDVDELYNDLNDLICKKRFDGFYIRVSKVQNDIQVIIEMNIYEDLYEDYNSDNESDSYEHILAYFENLKPTNVQENINVSIVPDMFINVGELSEEKFEQMQKELREHGIEIVKLNKSIHRKEQGAGGWWEQFIIGVIFSGISYDLSKGVVKSIITRVLDFPSLSEGLDSYQLLDNVSDVMGTSRAMLKINEFELLEDGNYSVVLLDRYDTYLIVCKPSGEIEKIKKQHNSYTHI